MQFIFHHLLLLVNLLFNLDKEKGLIHSFSELDSIVLFGVHV